NNSCLNPASETYKCNTTGATQIFLDNCGIANIDLPDVAACFDVVGRDKMTRIYLRYNSLTSITADLFEGFGRLERIYLSHNSLVALPATAFQDLGTLQWLLFEGNTLSALSEDVFQGLGQLERLTMSQNSLTTLPAEVFSGLTGLQELSLTSNPGLQCVPSNEATTLEVDDLSSAMCGCLPAEAVTCEDGVFCMPGEFGYTCATPAPSPARNPCLNPASDAYQCNANGTEIALDYCGITDDDLEDVASCLDVFGRDTATGVYLRFNYLTALPENLFQGMGHVEHIYLNNNDLSSLSVDIFQSLGKLTVLNLNGNALISLAASLFQGLGQLEHLWLNMNLLSTLPAELFEGLGQLKSLDLRLNPDLACVPTNVAEIVETTELSSDVCGCSLATALLCDTGLTCMPGHYGYTCATSAPTPAPMLPGNNTCLDPDTDGYVCSTDGTEIDFSYCGITDDILDEVAACMDVFGRDVIKSVHLRYNYLTTVSEDLFQGLQHVEHIYLNDNDIDSLPAEVFQGLTDLHSINLNRNSLSALPGSIFQQQGVNSTWPGGLREFHANMNLLTTLPAELFEGLDLLETLDLRLNPDLQCVPTNAAVTLEVDYPAVGFCECTPVQAVACPVGLTCVAGEFGYTCSV
ncbi:unnamed protein product, partial [Scytosiphon promiscuus]